MLGTPGTAAAGGGSYAGGGGRAGRWLVRVPVLAVLLLLPCALLLSRSTDLSASSSLLAALRPGADATAHTAEVAPRWKLHATRDGYDSVSAALQHYPWHAVLEPHQPMTLSLLRTDAADAEATADTMRWTLQDADGNTLLQKETTAPAGTVEEEEVEEGASKTSHAITYTCTEGGTLLSLTVQAVGGENKDEDKDEEQEQESFDVACKYVRRDLYSLTDDDLQRFLTAFATVAKTDYEDGVATYGEHFTNLQIQAAKHAWNCTTCTPYHGQWSLFTSHEAFIFEIERAMQLVDPSVAMHYWDYPFDIANIPEEDGPGTIAGIHSLPVFDMLGDGDADDHWHITSGPFAYLRIPHMTDSFVQHAVKFNPKFNAYGFLTESGGVNPSKYLTRVNHVCGYSGVIQLPAADSVLKAMEAPTSYDFHGIAERLVHTGVHTFGGVSKCVADFNVLEKATGMISTLDWTVIFESVKKLDTWGSELTCPDDWSQGAPFDPTTQGGSPCTETCGGFLDFFEISREDLVGASASGDEWVHELKHRIDWTSAIEFLEYAGLYKVFGAMYSDALTTKYNPKLGREVYYFDGATSENNNIGFRELLAYTCISARGLSPMLTPFVSPLDPLFHVVHNLFNRMVEARRIVPRFSQSGAEYHEIEGCDGYGYNDLMPFSNFMGDTEGNWYTNKDLYELFDPTSVRLPYIWDELDFARYPVPSE